MKIIIPLFVLSLLASPLMATDKMIHDYSNNTTPPSTYQILLDPGTGVYVYSTIAQVISGTTNGVTGDGGLVRSNTPTINSPTITGAGSATFASAQITNATFVNGIISTNIFSPTNAALGGAIIDFLYTETTTNAAGTIAYTGFSGFSPTNYNWKIIHILANGSDRTVTFPTNTRLPVPPACVVTNGTQKDVLIQLQQGVFTNVTWYSTL